MLQTHVYSPLKIMLLQQVMILKKGFGMIHNALSKQLEALAQAQGI